MLGDLFLLGHRFQLREGKHLGIRHQATDLQRITDEVVSGEDVEGLGARQRAVGPEIRRDLRLAVLTVGIKRFDETFEPADEEAAGFLNQSRMPDRERRSQSPGDYDNRHRRQEYSEADTPIVVNAGE